LEARELWFLLLMGAFQGIELALVSNSYRYLSIAENRMVMASTVVIQLFTAVLWRIERIWWLKWLAAAVLVGGAATQALDCTDRAAGVGVIALVCGPHGFHADPGATEAARTKSSWQGWVMVVSSVLISANRWALTQYVFQRSPVDSAFRRWGKIQMMPYMSAGTIVVCLFLAAMFEPEAFAEFVVRGGVQNLVSFVLLVSFSIALLTMCELLIVSMTAATVMVILAVVNNIPMILAGVIINHDVVFRNQWIGFALCSTGALIYFYARNLDHQVDDAESFVASAGSVELSSRATLLGAVNTGLDSKAL
jgi:drug/metabolite transporter (DMT)-like permease